MDLRERGKQPEKKNKDTGYLPVKRRWTQEEDEALVATVRKLGKTNWARVAKAMKMNREARQCRERWASHLNPALNKSPWSEEEDHLLRTLHAKLGNRWCTIAENLPGRSDLSVKNRFISICRMQERQRKDSSTQLSKTGNILDFGHHPAVVIDPAPPPPPSSSPHSLQPNPSPSAHSLPARHPPPPPPPNSSLLLPTTPETDLIDTPELLLSPHSPQPPSQPQEARVLQVPASLLNPATVKRAKRTLECLKDAGLM